MGINWYPGHMVKTKRQIKENIQNLIHNEYDNYYAVVKIDKLFVTEKK